jgi:hypothetical protein
MAYTALITRTYWDQWLESSEQRKVVKPLSPSMVFIIDKGWLMCRDHSVEGDWQKVVGVPVYPIEGLVCGEFTPGYSTTIQGEGKAYYFEDIMIIPGNLGQQLQCHLVFKPHS